MPASPPAAVPHSQIVQLYEEAMLKASQKRFEAKPVRTETRTVKPAARRRWQEHTSEGSTTALDVELRWLYQQAAEKKSR
jgi:hypothetical protein